MAKATYHRLDIATRQLETAVVLFLSDGDRYSVITLAGAASGILDQLVLNQGKEPFLDFARQVRTAQSGVTPARGKYNKHIKDHMGIDAMKHHGPNDPPEIELDVEAAAERAVTRAIADYIELKGQEDVFVKRFLQWTWVTKDGQKLMDRYNAGS
jgi:hypothetical protein